MNRSTFWTIKYINGSFFQVYEWSRFRNTGSHTRITIIPRIPHPHSPEVYALLTLDNDIPGSNPVSGGIQAHDCTVFHWTEPFNIIHSSSRHNFNNIERDIHHENMPLSFIVKLGLTGYTLFFLFLLKNIDCG